MLNVSNSEYLVEEWRAGTYHDTMDVMAKVATAQFPALMGAVSFPKRDNKICERELVLELEWARTE